MLGLHSGSVVSAETLIELLWGDDPPRTAAKALQTHISAVRRTLGDGFVLTEGVGWTLAESEVDASRYKTAARLGRDAAATHDMSQAVTRFEQALTLWRGTPELPDTRRGISEKTRWIEGHAALVEDRADVLLTTGRAAEIIGDLEAAVADAPLRERRWGQLMLALYRAGRQGEALGAYQRARTLLADELGIDPGPELRRLETLIVGQDAALEIPAAQDLPSVTRTVTFLLTDIEGSTAAWEADAGAMAAALARHDDLVQQVVTSRAGRLIKTRGEGDATFSVFERASAAAAAAIELQEAISHEPWGLQEPMRIRVALHTGEVELRDGDYFGRAVNRAARLRSLAIGGQILCSGAIAELVVDSLPDDVVLADVGMRQLKNLARPEHVFELRLETSAPPQEANDAPIERPDLPAVLTGPGPFVGRGRELEGLVSAWQTALAGGTHAVLIAGEPGVGKTRLAGEWSRQAYQLDAIVLYGRCDEDLGAPYQPFAEALRSLVPCLGASRLRGMRGVEALLPLVPGLTDLLPDLAAPTRADPETERYALFDAVVALLEVASAGAPVVLILDDLHWAAKPTLLLLRHLLRFGDRARVQIVGTYRSTDLDRSHPLAAMLADLHRGAGSGTANRLALTGLDEDDVTAYVTEAGYNDEELARALASVTGGNPFFLIEALRHVDETGGVWDPTTLPQGVRETVSRRLSRLTAETNTALAAAAVVGSRFALDLVEKVVEQDLVDAFDEACKAGIVIEEPGGRYRFNHAIVRQSLLAELPSVRRLRLHQRIATTLENEPGADDELLAELAHHYFECAWAGNAAKAVEYCRRAADQAVARLAYEGAADLYGQALHALEEIDDELPDREDQAGELLVARCEALLAAGDVASAAGAVAQLQHATVNSARLAAWATCFDGQLSMLIHPERLDEVETALGLAAQKLAELDDAAGEATAHTIRAACLARLGRIGDCEIALDDALTAARRARDHRRVNAVLAGAPLAALWGPNPVPRAGGRCLDVVRLLRITTDSPAVEATSTRCQAVLEAFRGRAEAARRMIDSARRTVTELGLRHALLEVQQFAGIVELVADDPAAAETHLRKAYNGFRRMGLDADTAETAALLGRTCLALDRDAEADELCSESEHLAGHALKASIAWRTLRAKLLARGGDHVEARRVAEAAVSLAASTDALVDHGEACLSLATVLGTAGDAAGARAAAERAVDLYERKGAAALAEKARLILGDSGRPSAPAPAELPPVVELDNACIRSGKRVAAAINREAWDEFERLYAPEVFSESHRKVIGFTHAAGAIVPPEDWAHEVGRILGASGVHVTAHDIAVRGERLALCRMAVGTADASPGAPRDEFLQIYAIDEEGRICLQIFFDMEDMEAAIAELDAAQARFAEDAHRQVRRLESTASQAVERYFAHFAARDWDALAKILADDFVGDDRRRVVNGGVRNGRDAEIANMRAIAEIGYVDITSTPIATRGERLVLARHSFTNRDWPEPLDDEMIDVVEIDSQERIVAQIAFDSNNIDAALAELDARYLAGEAAAYAHVLRPVMDTVGELNRHEPGPMLGRLVFADHRRVPFGSAENYGRAIEELWTLVPDARYWTKAVHALDAHGLVSTLVIEGTDAHGNELQWGRTFLFLSGGPLVEVYEEADLDAALARFGELRPQMRRLENAASHAAERHSAYFAARDWDALADVLADEFVTDDRRRAVNAGIRHGRDAEIANMQAAAEVGITYTAFVVIATRGERLILTHASVGGGGGSAEFSTDVMSVVEINSHNKIAAFVIFELDDFDAALAELDARYLAGEAAAHARVWSRIMAGHAALNRQELPPITPDCATIDHRLGTAFAPGELVEYLSAGWDLKQTTRNYVEVVHRLSDLGAVWTDVGQGVSDEGFDAEWQVITVATVEDDMVNRCEIFDEGDLEAALAKFDQLSRPAPRLENGASQASERYMAHFAARDWDALAKVLAADICVDDRRRLVNAGIKHGRDAEIANLQAAAEVGIAHFASVVIAARGQRLILAHVSGGEGSGSGEFLNEVLGLIQINSDGEISAIAVFDLDDFDAAITELDARYLAGEAAPHAHTWSVITAGYAALNRHELPSTTTDWVNIDHRRGTSFASGEMPALLDAAWNLTTELRHSVEAVHRLNDLGAVITNTSRETSKDGFDAEWRVITVASVEGDMLSRCEVFDEADLDAALARFDQLNPPPPRLENAAGRVAERASGYFTTRDWDALADVLADNFVTEDRRRAVNAGIRHGRDAEIANWQAAADVGFTNLTLTDVATRGGHLILIHLEASGRDPEAIRGEFLVVIEIDADERIVVFVVFDLDDLEAAIAELDARYIADEAAPHAHTWSVIAGVIVAHNRREIAPVTTDMVSLDHRRGAAFAPGEGLEYIRIGWDLGQSLKTYIERAHRLNDLGAVFTWAGHGTSREGFDAEWRGVTLMTVDGEMVSRMEVFDEGDLDAALAKFDQLSRPTPRLENAASQAYERFRRYFADRDWAAMGELLTPDTSVDDQRRVVNAEIRRGRDVEIANMRAFADIGAKKSTATVIAIRGEHLVLCRTCIAGDDEQPGGFRIEMLNIVETTAEMRILARVAYDPDDIDAAIEELDARYIAGEAAPYRDAWSVIAAGYAALNRYEVPPSAPDYVNIDHRLRATFEAADLGENLRTAWDLTPELTGYIEVVHRLSGLGALVTHAAHGTTQDGLDAEWRGIHFLTLDGGMVNRCEMFDEADMDTALAKFDQLGIPALRLKNAVAERISVHISTRDWEALAQDFADDYCLDDRRRVVNAGVMHGRDAGAENTRVAAEVGLLTNFTSTIIASRGERLTLERFHASGADPESIQNEALNIVEIDADERIAAVVMFDVDDIDAAIAELDARYLAGEAAAHALTWARVTRAYAALNRRELPATTRDWVNIDHRRLAPIADGDLGAYLRATWDLSPQSGIYIESAHRLHESGAVVTHVVNGSSQQGFDAEWRTVVLTTYEGDKISRCELFDEANLDAALARLEELQPQPRRLENGASRLHERFLEYYAAADSQAMAEMLVDNYCSDDRRRLVGSGVRHGRDAHIADMRARAELWNTNLESTVMAIRGERLALMRIGLSDRDDEPEAFSTEALAIGEIDADERLVATVTFDFDEIDAAFEELDARYLAGEAAAHAHTWSVIANVNAAFNRHEMPSVTPHWVNIDHRPVTAFAPGDMAEYIHATWDVAPDIRNRIVAVHRLTDLGAVNTQTTHGISQEGFEAEWREITLLTVEGDSLDRIEIFDETDMDAGFARFEELQRQPPRLKTAASRIIERYLAHFAARDWAALAKLLADDIVSDDRRRVVNAGIRRGRDVHIADNRVVVEVSAPTMSSNVIAARGERLALAHLHIFNRGMSGEVGADVLGIAEIDADERIVALVTFDLDDIDAAFEELDARYLAGEDAACQRVWSVVTEGYAQLNKHELPVWTSDWLTIDHRMRATFEAADQIAYIRGAWDITPNLKMYIEAVHRLSSLGAVVTHAAYGSTPEGFAAEWRMIELLVVGDDNINRCELFDEAGLDAAMARFAELQPQPRRLENAASQLVERFRAFFAERNWAAVAENSADEVFTEDRRSVVSSGILHGRDVDLANVRAIADLGATDLRSTVIATRGERLVLTRLRLSGRDHRPEAFHSEMLGIVEIDANNRVAARFLFDIDDIDAAFEELDAQYLVGEAAAYSRVWSVIARTTAAFNRHELPPTMSDWVTIDHRTLAPADASDLPAAMHAIWDLTPDLSTHIEAVHRLSSFGAVVTYTAYGTSIEGFAAEWRMVDLLGVERDRIKRCEIFDEADLDAALARFDELERQTPSFGNAATRIWPRVAQAVNRRDVDGLLALAGPDYRFEDRRKGLRDGFEGQTRMREVVRTIFEMTPSSWRLEVEPIAIRGPRLSLVREYYRDVDEADRPIVVELLQFAEVNDDDLLQELISFDPDDLDDAFAEITARWVASGEVAYPDLIQAVDRINATINRHDWDAVATHFAGADYVNHRQLAQSVNGTIADWLTSMQTIASLVPDLWVELAEVLARSAIGIVGRIALKGTSTDGVAAEISFVVLMLLRGERVTRLEAFDEDQRDVALARLQEFNRPV
nr:BTAD domain-containing putative transcriptional regulator [Mycobacterium cookii]